MLCIVQNSILDWQYSGNLPKWLSYTRKFTPHSSQQQLLMPSVNDTSQIISEAHAQLPPLAALNSHDGTRWFIFARLTLSHKTSLFPLLQLDLLYQEQLLSPLFLHFAGKELVDYECGSYMVKVEFVHARYFSTSNPKDYTESPWRLVIMQYPALALTFSVVVLPALSGFVKVFAAHLQDGYSAELWKHTIHRDLLWYCRRSISRLDMPVKPWRAPSWSFAAVRYEDGENTFLTATHELPIMKNIECRPVEIDPTGELTEAQLTLVTIGFSGTTRTRHGRS